MVVHICNLRIEAEVIPSLHSKLKDQPELQKIMSQKKKKNSKRGKIAVHPILGEKLLYVHISLHAKMM